MEGLIDAILEANGIPTTLHMKDKCKKLKELTILKDMPSPECDRCHYKKRDIEFNNAYDIYSLLSHYARHPGE
jgi:hypothetical protein